jgi:hypothetical protein
MLDAIFRHNTLFGDVRYTLCDRLDIICAQGLEETIARRGPTTTNREAWDELLGDIRPLSEALLHILCAGFQ